jgi:hypothetical protein
MHQGYAGTTHLRLRSRVFRSLGDEVEGPFLLDKILHNEYYVSTALLDRETVFPIFMIREPKPTIWKS